MTRGKLISFEGIDRSGKSLQAGRLAEWLEGRGHTCLLTCEPGASELGKRLRELLLDKSLPRQPLTCALLFAADRHEHVKTLIEPALAAGKWVVSDRFCDSMLAYQGGQGIDLPTLVRLNEIACQGLRPDLTVLLQISPGTSRQRRGSSDYFDREGDYLQQVAANYGRLAEKEPERFAVIDSEQQPARVAELVQQAVAERLPEQ